VALPQWLIDLRHEEVVDKVQNDPRSSGDLLLGVESARIFRDVIGGGQADFDDPWVGTSGSGKVMLSGADKVLLYAYFNQKGHLEELLEGFSMLLRDTTLDDLVVLDLGCGPFTGGLALAAVMGSARPFTYVGVDTSVEMHVLGERVAGAAAAAGNLTTIVRHWSTRLASVAWSKPAGWQPVLVIVSYLLASATIDCSSLVAELNAFLNRLGRGPVVLFYTNAVGTRANRHFSTFRSALEVVDFECVADRAGSITVDAWGGPRRRELRYALFRRTRRDTLQLGED
jgi:hypothetical protein